MEPTSSSNGNNRGVTDTSNTQPTLPSKVVSSSTRPSTATDKENLPSLDKPYRPSTAAPTTSAYADHSSVNGTTNNGVSNSLLASASIDTSTSNTNALKTTASGGTPSTSNAITNRTNIVNDKTRPQTVRLPNTTVRGKEAQESVPSSSRSIKKNDSINSNDRKPLLTNTGER